MSKDEVNDILKDGALRGNLIEQIQYSNSNELVSSDSVSYTHLRAHETVLDLVCRLLLEKKKKLTI